MTAFNIDTEF